MARRLASLILIGAAALLGAARQATPEGAATLTVGKSVIFDSPANVRRVAVANSDLAEAVVVNPREVLLNGRAPGETTLTLWLEDGTRRAWDVLVRPSTVRLDAMRRQLTTELPGQSIEVAWENDTAFLRGTATDMLSAERATAIAASLGKVVNLLRVKVPPAEAQVLLKVRFANVDRAASNELGMNLFSTGGLRTPGSLTTGQFAPPQVTIEDGKSKVSVADALNLFLFRPDLNLGATIKALESQRLLEILAEPNVLAIDGKEASFVAGGEFPFPTLQGGGAGLGAVTIQFREFGVRIRFLPVITPRGTIRLRVIPEVSSLDFANGLVFQGFNIPALATRRVETEAELEDRQSFAIAGLLDNRMTEAFNKVPGIGSIPILGRFFQSRTITRNNSELIVIVTPELVRPIPRDQPLPEVKMPKEFLAGTSPTPPRTPEMEKTGPVPVTPPEESVPMESLVRFQAKSSKSGGQQGQQAVEFAMPPASTPAPAPPQMGAGSR